MECPDLERVELGQVVHVADQLRARVAAGVRRVQAVGVSQQHEQLRGHEHREVSGEEVVVPEGDLVGRGRVVLVGDGHHPPVEQLTQGVAGVQVLRAPGHVPGGEQHLRGDHRARTQQLVVDAVQLALPHRRGRLQLGYRSWPHGQPHHAHPTRDRPRGDHHALIAGGVQRGDGVADTPEHLLAQLPVLASDDGRAQLDDDRSHEAWSVDGLWAGRRAGCSCFYEDPHKGGQGWAFAVRTRAACSDRGTRRREPGAERGDGESGRRRAERPIPSAA